LAVSYNSSRAGIDILQIDIELGNIYAVVNILHHKQGVIAIALLYVLAAWWPLQLDLPYTVPNSAVVDSRGVILESPGLIRADARPLVKAIQSKPGVVFRVELLIHPASIDQRGPARILEIGRDHYRMNLMIGQTDDAIVARVRHFESDSAGIPPLVARDALAAGRATKIILVIFSDRIELHVDGKLIDVRHTEKAIDTWSEDAVLTIGDSPAGERAWLGRLESGHIGISGVETLDLVKLSHDMRPGQILHVPERLGKVLDSGGLPPVGFLDILVNILGFMPLGFFAARAWRARPLQAAMLLVFCTSMTMELGQIAFADRIPALPDLFLNWSGGFLGVLLFSQLQKAGRA